MIAPQLDHRVLVFSLLAAVVSAVLFGLAPAWQSLKTQLVPALKSSEPGQTARQRTIGRNVLVVAQIALSMVLLVAAGMLQAGFRKALDLDPGFRTDHLMMMSTGYVVRAGTRRSRRATSIAISSIARGPCPASRRWPSPAAIPLDRGDLPVAKP